MWDSQVDNEKGFMDDIGGHHVGGTGYSPSGDFYGECCRATCRGCIVVEKAGTSLPSQARAFVTLRFSKVI